MTRTAASSARDYYRLAKPGIVYGNLLTVAAAFLFGSRWQLGAYAHPAALVFGTLAGSSLVIASGCVYNNWLDRELDRKMARTKDRALAAGRIPVSHALWYGAALGLLGLALLALAANLLTAAIALFGWVAYVFLYGWAKRAGWWGALVGSVPGAVPVVLGYTAAAGRLDLAALLLFVALAAWQLPHFYAIALYRLDDYAAAGIPVLPRAKGAAATKRHLLASTGIFLVAALLLVAFGYAGDTFCVVVGALGAAWFWRTATGFRKGTDDAAWARGVFLFSLIVLLGFSVMLAAAPFLP